MNAARLTQPARVLSGRAHSIQARAFRGVGIPYRLTQLGRLTPHLEMLADLQAQVREESARKRAIPNFATESQTESQTEAPRS